ncbi:MAG: response regulator [Candidatus Binatia bacterium]
MTKIVIADDETAVLSSTGAILKVFGFEVATVAIARDILPVLLTERPDLLLQDARMPGLDLVEHLKAIRGEETLADLPVLVFTANVDAEEVWKNVGADGVVEKPFNPRELKALIEKHLAAKGRSPTAEE